ncbi:hypothetical protein NEF87_003764 [Candidatus Lokiarchaeum ossiferum]|uniref:PAS domain S-box protein n=1 Tax=Candidatus Lokiarchaeum ossiferum TaxID=2951803 RepID=A0ABY6HY55_9ARCH|nr:hypothetical protein NEF87_003764 [Candidatus Lokiarchaeum sp. B-35]
MVKESPNIDPAFLQQIKEIRQTLYLLLEIDRPEKVLERFLEGYSSILKADASTIVFWESELGFFNTLYNIPNDIPLKGMILIPEQGGLDGRIFREQHTKPLCLSNYSKNMDAYAIMKPIGYQYAYGIPLFSHNQTIIGTMCFYFKERTKKITQNEEILLEEIGQQTSIAILNARLNQQLEDSKKDSEESRNFLDLLLNSSPDIIINTDLTGKIKFWNKAAEKSTGFPANIMMNQKLPLVSDENEEFFYSKFGEARKGKTIFNFKILLKTKKLKGAETEIHRTINMSLVPVRNQKENLDSILLTGQDISEKQNLKKQVDEYNLALNQKDLALIQKDELLLQTQEELIIAEKLATIGLISDKLNHQINNPLMGIISALSIHLDDIEELEKLRIQGGNTITENISHFLKPQVLDIISEGERIKFILKELRHFSEVAKEVHYRDNTELFEVINQVINELKDEPAYADIKLKLSKKINKAKILGNFNQLKYVIRVMLENSTRAINLAKIYDPSRQPEIEIYINKFILNQKKYIRFELSDNGIGLNTDQISRIFEPFYTLWDNPNQNPNDPEENHVGLSLATAQIILHNHHAYINVEGKKLDPSQNEKDRKNSGTKITIDFPEI